MEKKHFIFDLDGTLFCTKKAIIQSYTAAAAALDVSLNDSFFRELHGNKFEKTFSNHFPQQTHKIQQIVQKKIELFPNFLDLVRRNDSLLSWITQVPEYAVKSIVSNARRETVDCILEHFDDKHFFQHILSAEDLPALKPSASGFLKAIALSGWSKEECVVFEDSSVGIDACKAANLSYIQIRFTS